MANPLDYPDAWRALVPPNEPPHIKTQWERAQRAAANEDPAEIYRALHVLRTHGLQLGFRTRKPQTRQHPSHVEADRLRRVARLTWLKAGADKHLRRA